MSSFANQPESTIFILKARNREFRAHGGKIVGSFSKQEYEIFTIHAEFEENLASAETLSTAVVTATDVDGEASSVIDSYTVNDTEVTILVKAGSATVSPYTINCRVVTSTAHRWEADITMRVED